MADESYRYFKI